MSIHNQEKESQEQGEYSFDTKTFSLNGKKKNNYEKGEGI